jgi:hypothetical protein
MVRVNLNLAALAGCFGLLAPFRQTAKPVPISPPSPRVPDPGLQQGLVADQRLAVGEAVRLVREHQSQHRRR